LFEFGKARYYRAAPVLKLKGLIMFTRQDRRSSTPLRVSIHHNARSFALKLEDDFRETDAPEVEARWRTAESLLRGRAFEVDLSSVTSVEPSANDLLVRMRDGGAEFVRSSKENAAPGSGFWHRLESVWAG
jgi:hypothetical protein